MFNNTKITNHSKNRFYCFSVGSNYYLYDSNRISIWQVPEIIYNNINNNHFSLEDYADEKNKNFFLLLLNKKKPFLFEYRKDHADISICYSKKCNMNCTYCFSENKSNTSLSFEQIKKIIDYTEEKIYPDVKGYIYSIGYTNEIFLDLDLLEEIQNYLNKLQSYELLESDFNKDIEILKKTIPSEIILKYQNETSSTLETLNEIIKHENLNEYFKVPKQNLYEGFRSYLDSFDKLDEFHKVLINRKVLENVWQKDLKECLPKWQSLGFMTNGTILTDRHIQFLKANDKNEIFVSIDGPKEVHDFSRKQIDGKGTFEVVIETIRKLQSNNITVNASTVLIPEFPNVYEIVLFLKSIGIKKLSLHLVRDKNGIGFNRITLNQLLQSFDLLIDEMIKEIEENDYSLVYMLKETILMETIFNISNHLIQEKRCTWGDNVIIDEKNDVYRCLYLIGNENEKVNNYFDGFSEEQIRDDILVDKCEPCNTCWAKYLCGGTCYYNSLIKNKNKMIADEIECEYRKALIQKSLRLFVVLKEKDLIKSVISLLK